MARWFLDRSPAARDSLSQPSSTSARRPVLGMPGLGGVGLHGRYPQARPGQVFVAVRGDRLDGHSFVVRALEHGAAGVVVERPCPEAGRLQVVVPDSRAAHARISHALAGAPADRVRAVGVTGRRGKGATGLFLPLDLPGPRRVRRLDRPIGLVRRGLDPAERPGLARSRRVRLDPGLDGRASLRLRCPRPGREDARPSGGRRGRLRGGRRHQPGRSGRRSRSRGPRPTSTDVARLARLVMPGGSVVINADEPEADPLGSVNLSAPSGDLQPGASRPHLGRARAARPLRLPVPAPRVRPGGDDLARPGRRGARRPRPGCGGGGLVAGDPAPRSRRRPGIGDPAPGRLEPVLEGQDFEVRVDQARTAPELSGALASLRVLAPGRLICVVGADGNSQQLRRAALARARRGRRRPGGPDRRQPPGRGSRPDSRRPPRRLRPPRPGPRRAPTAGRRSPLPWRRPAPATPS